MGWELVFAVGLVAGGTWVLLIVDFGWFLCFVGSSYCVFCLI